MFVIWQEVIRTSDCNIIAGPVVGWIWTMCYNTWFGTVVLTCAQCRVPHSLSRVRSLCVPPGHTGLPQWYSHCNCERKHLSAASSKAKILGQFCLKNSGISLHTPIKDIFLSTIYASQDVDALCDMIYTQLSRNASKNWKTTVVCLNALFHLIQPTSHYEPQGASFLRPPRCQQLEETFTQMPLGLLWKQSLTWHPQPSATEAAAQIC